MAEAFTNNPMKQRQMKLRTRFLGLIAIAVVWLAFWFRANNAVSEELPPEHSRVSVTTKQGERQYVIHIPKSCENKTPSPMVIMLHGFGGTALSAAKETGWSLKADREAFVIVYPEASRPDPAKPQSFRLNPQSWNDGSGRFHAGEKNIDDVAFIDTMIDEILNAHPIDPQRIYVTGFSNGASMTFRLGAELSNRFAAIAPVSGTCWIESPKPSSGLSICYVTGTSDSLNPIDGGYPKLTLGGKDQGGKSKPPVQLFLDRWVAALKCSREPIVDETANGVRRRLYQCESREPEIVYVSVDGLGHHWPGGASQVSSLLVGKPSDKLKATDEIWDFFKSHPK
jgi:polyhydroxybutyrate depolymerase